MSKLKKFANRLSYNAVSCADAAKNTVSFIYDELTSDEEVVQDIRSRFDKMVLNIDDEQINRVKIFTYWLQAIWCISILGILTSLIKFDVITMIYFLLLAGWLYIFLGYRVWVLNTRTYPTFKQYLKLIWKAPTKGLPYNNKHIEYLTGLKHERN